MLITRYMNSFIYIFLTLLLIMGCAHQANVDLGKSTLIKGNPGMNNYQTLEPGETSPLERAYEIEPPVIPHSIKEFSLTRDSNDCLECHANGDELSENHVATKIPKSHYMNEHTGEKSEDSITSYRYKCTQCHVPQTVENQSE